MLFNDAWSQKDIGRHIRQLYWYQVEGIWNSIIETYTVTDFCRHVCAKVSQWHEYMP